MTHRPWHPNESNGMQILNSPARRGRVFLFLTGLLLALLLAACGDSPTATSGPTSPPATTQAVATGSATTVTTTQAGVATSTQAAPTAATNPTTVAAGTTAASGQSTPGQTTLATAPATITKSNGEKINMTIELARTSQEQETGLMGRLSVPDETGMLFIFGQPGRIAFWMKDTPLALSIAFIAQDGKIVDIQDMESYSLQTHSPNQDYIYALEVAKGYFARKGVKPGDLFTFKA